MKSNFYIICILILLSAYSCGPARPVGLALIDVTVSYPEKELILQDIADIEYVPLETTDRFLTAGDVLHIDDEHIVTCESQSGQISFFDRKTGKGVKTVNRRGGGAGEYRYVTSLIVDKENDEMFVVDGITGKVNVYALDGKFKRDFEMSSYILAFNFNSEYLLCYTDSWNKAPYALVSKEDGKTNDIPVAYKERINMSIFVETGENSVTGWFAPRAPILRTHSGFILSDVSMDTVYRFSAEDRLLSPLLIRTPSAPEMETPVSLNITAESSDYIFISTVRKEMYEETGFPIAYLMYYKKTGDIYRQKIVNGDYTGKNDNFAISPMDRPAGMYINTLSALDLTDANEAGNLHGKLKDIASTLKEDDNPVLMIVKFK